MEDPAAFYCIALHDPTLRRGLVASARSRRGRDLPRWSATGARILRRGLGSLLHLCAVRLEAAPREAISRPSGVMS